MCIIPFILPPPHSDCSESRNNVDSQRAAELGSTTFIKTVLMLLVVLYHSIVFWRGDWFTENPAELVPALGTAASFLITFLMYAFVLVSGYIFSYQRCERGSYKELLPFVANKAKRLLLPYLAVAAVWVIPIQLIFFDYTPLELAKNFLLAISPNQLWFLWMLFDLFIIFHLLSRFIEKHNILGLIVVLAMYAVGTIAPMLPNVFMIWRAMTYAPAFWLGFKLRQYGTELFRKIPIFIYPIVHIALFILDMYLPLGGGIVGRALSLAMDFVINHLGALSAFLLLSAVGTRINTSAQPIKFLGERSMTIYLFHQQAIYFFIYLLDGHISPYLVAAASFIGALAISLLISLLLHRFNITRLLIGEKPIKKRD